LTKKHNQDPNTNKNHNVPWNNDKMNKVKLDKVKPLKDNKVYPFLEPLKREDNSDNHYKPAVHDLKDILRDSKTIDKYESEFLNRNINISLDGNKNSSFTKSNNIQNKISIIDEKQKNNQRIVMNAYRLEDEVEHNNIDKRRSN